MNLCAACCPFIPNLIGLGKISLPSIPIFSLCCAAYQAVFFQLNSSAKKMFIICFFSLGESLLTEQCQRN